MNLEDALKKIDLNFINSNFTNGKIPLEFRSYESDGEDGDFWLPPVDYEEEAETGFELILIYLLNLIGYQYDFQKDWDELREYLNPYSNNAIQFLIDLHDDYYIENDTKNLIDFEVMECVNNWKNGTKLTKPNVQNLIQHYNSLSKHFEIVSY